MTLRRALAVVVLAYVAVDLSDPSVPGIFSFARDPLFMEGRIDDRPDVGAERSHAIGPPQRLDRAIQVSRVLARPTIPPARTAVRPMRTHGARTAPARSDSPSEDH